MCLRFRKLFTFGVHWTLILLCHNIMGQNIDEIIQGYRHGSKCGKNKVVSVGNKRNIQNFFEYIDDQINIYTPNQKKGLYKQLAEHPEYQSAKENCITSLSTLTTCDPLSNYRTYDGSCNNLMYPRWGSVDECIQRFLPIYYEGTHGIRKSVTGLPLPRPRDLTVNICSGFVRPSPRHSFLLVVFAQFVAHDISSSTSAAGVSTLKCCPPSPDMDERCFPIIMRSNDPFYSKYNRTCIPVFRTDPCKKCSIGKRQQANIATAALDVSVVYGTSKEEADQLRTFDGSGSLIALNTRAGTLLPRNHDPKMLFCSKQRTTSCFKSGDIRVNQHSGLMSMHTLFMREHNRVVEKLKQLNPHWEEDRLYQEGRKIVGGELQAIAYKELLPLLVGGKLMDGYSLRVGKDDSCFGTLYDPNVRLGTWTEFSTAAMRFHSTINTQTGMFNVTLKDLYSNTNLIRAGNMGALLTGLRQAPCAKFSKDFVKDVNGFLSATPEESSGQDLPSIDIARGRDHGMAPYIRVLEFCLNGNVKINEFDDLQFIMSTENIQLLKKNYADVEDIDAWLGMQMERNVYDGLLGPTAACMVAKQFFSLKYGDRFYFEHDGERPSFTPDQRQALTESTLSRIICDNTEIFEIQENALLLPSSDNPVMPCYSHLTLDLFAWKE